MQQEYHANYLKFQYIVDMAVVACIICSSGLCLDLSVVSSLDNLLIDSADLRGAIMWRLSKAKIAKILDF